MSDDEENTERALAPVTPVAPAAPYLRARLGDLPLAIDARLLHRLLMSLFENKETAQRELREAQGHAPRSALERQMDTIKSVTALDIALRAASLAALPVLRKFVRNNYPDAPNPIPPRGADPTKFLVGYVSALALNEAIKRGEWAIEYGEAHDGTVLIQGVHELPAETPPEPVSAGASAGEPEGVVEHAEPAEAARLDSPQPDGAHGAA